MKECTKCKQTQPLSEFYKSKKGKFGVRNLCKTCHLNLNRKPKKERVVSDEKQCTKCKQTKPLSEFYKCKKGKYGVRSKCKECYHIRTPEETKKYREYLKSYNKKRMLDENYRKHNIQRTIQSQKKRKLRDPKYKELTRRQKNLRMTVTRLNVRKMRDVSTSYYGCKPQVLKQYFESKFYGNMGWDNIREWQVDHIKPLKSFKDPLCKEAWHYTNFQPLFTQDHKEKTSKENTQ